jgi:hypothetical protein
MGKPVMGNPVDVKLPNKLPKERFPLLLMNTLL